MIRIPQARAILTLVVVLILLIVFKPWESLPLLVKVSPILVGLSAAGVIVTLLLNAGVYTLQTSALRAISFSRVLKTVMQSWVVESVTPGKLGSFAVAWFWQKDGLTLGEGAAIVLAYRLSLGAGAVLFGLAGVLVFFPMLHVNGLFIFLASVLVLSIFIFVFTGRKFLRSFIPPVLREKLKGFTSTLKGMILDPVKVLMLLGLALIQLACASFFFYLMFRTVGYDIGFFPILAAASIVQLAALIPISINGIGVREGLMALLLQGVGIPPAVTIVVSGINTATGYAVAFLFSVFWAKDLRTLKNEMTSSSKNKF